MTAHWNGGSGGKGSTPRPFSIAQDEYANRWDAIFGRDLPKENAREKAEAALEKLNSVMEKMGIDDESSGSNTDNR